MFHRRYILSGTAAGSLAALGFQVSETSAKARAIVATPGMKTSDPATAKALNAVFDATFKGLLVMSPGLCTAIGADKGELAYQKSKLDHSTDADRAKFLSFGRASLTALKGIDRSKLASMDRINLDTVIWDTTNQIDGATRFKGTTAGGPPYAVSQLTGSYPSTPDFLDSQHSVANKEDAEAYISRLHEFADVLNEETDNFFADNALGLTPPDFVLKRALELLKPMAATKAEDSNLVKGFARKLAEAKLDGDFVARASAHVGGPIQRALARQAEAVAAALPKSVHDAGIWRLPQGDERYAYAVKSGTTTSMTPDEVHKLGLDKVKEITAQIDIILKAQGLTKGTPGARMAAMYADPKLSYPNTDAAKDELLAYLNKMVADVYTHVPDYFNVLPKAKVTIKRVPKEIEAGAPGGYYNPGALDGSRPGAYYINLRDTAEQPKWLLPTLTHHEAVPGHHFQISIQQETDLPMLRKIGGFNAYVEGWALYAEQLSDEMGLYKDDPLGKAGYLHDALFRAVRLVVDSGMHHKRWSREKAIAYMVEFTGDKETAATTEIERYCVWPGQALGYMTGKLKWLKIRAAMQKHMGKAFSIKTFHDVGLTAGAVPLQVLEQVYRDRGLIV